MRRRGREHGAERGVPSRTTSTHTQRVAQGREHAWDTAAHKGQAGPGRVSDPPRAPADELEGHASAEPAQSEQAGVLGWAGWEQAEHQATDSRPARLRSTQPRAAWCGRTSPASPTAPRSLRVHAPLPDPPRLLDQFGSCTPSTKRTTGLSPPTPIRARNWKLRLSPPPRPLPIGMFMPQAFYRMAVSFGAPIFWLRGTPPRPAVTPLGRDWLGWGFSTNAHTGTDPNIFVSSSIKCHQQGCRANTVAGCWQLGLCERVGGASSVGLGWSCAACRRRGRPQLRRSNVRRDQARWPDVVWGHPERTKAAGGCGGVLGCASFGAVLPRAGEAAPTGRARRDP